VVYWPYITIFVSLLLILFFRRIDKRNLNFHKFKRYAEKLASDFGAYLDGKKEDLKGGIQDLEKAVSRAEKMLERIESVQQSVVEKHAELHNERVELETTRRELEKLKSLKTEIANEVARLAESLPSMKTLSKRVEKLDIEIAENEKNLRNATAVIPNIEKRVREKSEQAIMDVTDRILEEAKNVFSPISDEYRQSFEMMRESQQQELDRFRKETSGVLNQTNRNMSELTEAIDECRNRIHEVESGTLEGISGRLGELEEAVEGARTRIESIEGETTDAFMKRAEEEYGRYVARLEEKQTVYRDDIFKDIEEKSKDLSSYIARLEGRVQTLLDDVKKETDGYGENLKLEVKARESAAEELKERIISEIGDEANRNLLLIKPIASEMNEKLQAHRKEFGAIYKEIQSRITSQENFIKTEINNFKTRVELEKKSIFDGLGSQLHEARAAIAAMNAKIEEGVSSATDTVKRGFVQKLREYESEIRALEGRIGDLGNIARTGQKMIEERIDTVFQNYKPEIEQKMQSLQKETEAFFEQHQNRIVQKIDGIIEQTDTELNEKKEELKSFLEEMEREVNSSEEKLGTHEKEIIDNINSIRAEARDELVRELENLKSLFKDEKERALSRYGEELEGLKSRIDDLSSRADGITSVVEEKISEALGSAESSVRVVETNYLKTGEDMKTRLDENLKRVRREIDEIRETVGGLRNDMVADVNRSLEGFKQNIDATYEACGKQLKDKEQELFGFVNAMTDEARQEVERSKRDAGDMLAGFSEEALRVQEAIEGRIGEIEKRIDGFEKESVVLKRAGKFRDKVEEDIEKFSDLIAQLKEDKKNIMSLKKLMQNLKRDEGDISARVRQLKGDKKMVQDIAKNAEQAIGLISVVDDKIKLIESEREMLEKIEDGIKEMEKRFNVMKEKTEALESRDKDIEVSIDTITKTSEFIGNLEKRTNLLKESFEEIKSREEDIKKRITLLDEKSSAVTGKESKVDEVLSRFEEMDALVADIEERTKQLQSTREWLARVESRLTNLTKDAEGLIEKLSEKGAAGSGSKGKTAAVTRESESKVKTVLTLFEQKWTIPEICRVTKMSRGEVELILELNK